MRFRTRKGEELKSLDAKTFETNDGRIITAKKLQYPKWVNYGYVLDEGRGEHPDDILIDFESSKDTGIYYYVKRVGGNGNPVAIVCHDTFVGIKTRLWTTISPSVDVGEYDLDKSEVVQWLTSEEFAEIAKNFKRE